MEALASQHLEFSLGHKEFVAKARLATFDLSHSCELLARNLTTTLLSARKTAALPNDTFPIEREVMSHSTSILMLRNLNDVFGENDPARRRAAIDEMFHEDAVFYGPNGVHRGRDEIHRIAGVIKAAHPDFQYQPTAPPEELGDAGRVRWVSGIPGGPPAYAGTDFIIARNGRIAAIYLFFDPLP